MKTKNKNMKIEVKEITLKLGEGHDHLSYPSNGLYMVNYEEEPNNELFYKKE